MTLKETFEKVSFAELVEPLVAIDSEAKDNLYSFKEAFDLLRMMEAQPSDSIDIDIAMHCCPVKNPLVQISLGIQVKDSLGQAC